MNTDPIADLLTRIRNANMAHKESVNAPYSKIKENILKVMKQYNFIEDYMVNSDDAHKTLDIDLNQNKKDMELRRVSKPGQRIYLKNSDLRTVKSGLGISILSTSKGVMSNIQAKKENLGGELICQLS